MKAKLLAFLFLLTLIPVANAVIIEVKIPKVLRGEISSFYYNISGNLMTFKVEFYNSGSIGYKSRVRIDVFNDSQQIFTAWSEERKFVPGDRKIFELFWFTNLTGNFSGRIRAYFANEIVEKEFKLEKSFAYPAEKAFSISNFRTYENAVVFDLKSEKYAGNVVIVPENIPLGWIFQQKRLEIRENEVKTVAISYKPAIWSEENLTLSIASLDGKYFTQEEVRLKKESGFLGFIHYFIDVLKLAKDGSFDFIL